MLARVGERFRRANLQRRTVSGWLADGAIVVGLFLGGVAVAIVILSAVKAAIGRGLNL